MISVIPEIRANNNIIEMKYAVRGPIPQRAAELIREGKTIIPCNIGNPQALGQRPLTFYRQVMSIIEDPERIYREQMLRSESHSIPPLSLEVIDYAQKFLDQLPNGPGAYTESAGPAFIRKAVADFIDRRDVSLGKPIVPANPDSIFLTNGASDAVRLLFEILIGRNGDGIMIPIPQYPLYSAVIRRCGGTMVSYFLDEEAGWTLKREELERSISEARACGVNVSAIVVINPGNPTGTVLQEATIREVIDFAEDHGLLIIADEVYQENTYGDPFYSFAKVRGSRIIPLFSLHSTSKGFIGECGHRGGYAELRGNPVIKGHGITLRELILKQASVNLCSNTGGQAFTYMMVVPPDEGTELYKHYISEKESILQNLYAKGTKIQDVFSEMRGVSNFHKIAAMYLFPRIRNLPKGTTDFDYCMNLLEETGLCTVNGSGFGQKEGTSHLRIAFLPPMEVLEEVLPRWVDFHNRYVD